MTTEAAAIGTPEIDKAEAGARLKAARIAAGHPSQIQAARAAGLTTRHYADYEAGKKVPSWTKMLAIAASLGLDLKILMPEVRRSQR